MNRKPFYSSPQKLKKIEVFLAAVIVIGLIYFFYSFVYISTFRKTYEVSDGSILVEPNPHDLPIELIKSSKKTEPKVTEKKKPPKKIESVEKPGSNFFPTNRDAPHEKYGNSKYMRCDQPHPKKRDLDGLPAGSTRKVAERFEIVDRLNHRSSKFLCEWYCQRKLPPNPTVSPVKIYEYELLYVPDWHRDDMMEGCSVPVVLVDKAEDAHVVLFSDSGSLVSYSNDRRKTGQQLAYVNRETWFDDEEDSSDPYGTQPAYKSHFWKAFDLFVTYRYFSSVVFGYIEYDHFLQYVKDVPHKDWDVTNGKGFKKALLENMKTKNKEGLGCHFISKCFGDYKNKYWTRGEYLSNLENIQKIGIHTYGRCGGGVKKPENKKFFSPNVKADLQRHLDSIKSPYTTQMVQRALSKAFHYNQYKFAFVFENAMRPNYVTEKMIDCMALAPFTIPVYMGANNLDQYFRNDYKLIIDVNKFRSPQQLGDYLKFLDKNDTAYLEYFKWRMDGVTEISTENAVELAAFRHIHPKSKKNVDIYCRIAETYVKGSDNCEEYKD